MLTVAFPLVLYGPETDAPGRTNVGLQDPTVNLVFAGNWSLAGELPLINATKTLVSGPYLTGLMQYSSSGTAQYGIFWNDPNNQTGATLPAFPSPDTSQLQPFLQNSISKYGPDPGTGDLEHAPIEVVVLDPESSISIDPTTGKKVIDNGGFNVPGTYSSPGGGQENLNMIFVGTEADANGVVKDNFTQTLSHELAERMVNNAQLFGLPSAYNIDGHTKIVQVADGEQPYYDYRLDGNSVQAYWSDKDQAAIVPDFPYEFVSHKYVLTASWNTNDPKNPPLNGYELSVNGDEIFDPTNE